MHRNLRSWRALASRRGRSTGLIPAPACVIVTELLHNLDSPRGDLRFAQLERCGFPPNNWRGTRILTELTRDGHQFAPMTRTLKNMQKLIRLQLPNECTLKSNTHCEFELFADDWSVDNGDKQRLDNDVWGSNSAPERGESADGVYAAPATPVSPAAREIVVHFQPEPPKSVQNGNAPRRLESVFIVSPSF